MAGRYITRNGQFSIVGIPDAGALCSETPQMPNDPRWRTWPTTIMVPRTYGGSGQAVNVRTCFEEALKRVHDCIAPPGGVRCDAYFTALGSKRRPDMRRTLSDLLGYRLAFYRNGSLNPADDFTATGGSVNVLMGEVLTVNNVDGVARITISAYSARSPIALAATIVHELAHVAGAPGRPSDADWGRMSKSDQAPYYAAEGAIKACGFANNHYHPEIYGHLQEYMQRRMKTGSLA